ncbi:MAG TPA: molybdopterin-dependent oxidoreductase [Candidatus Sulfotelmatobacter sp.]|jgi:DMSO/TMAO reductase YedYZ molybdopterin-dependent catalytic subunit|nr:molybdopterin-dependent oxidoreductase [Candidatus Sulfotelmatobacter sp.]
MNPENVKPGADKSQDDARQSVEPSAAESKTAEQETAEPKTPPPEIAAQKIAGRAMGPTMTERKFGQVSRRELLKLAPVLALGAFAIPSFQESLLKKGLGFSDWASARLFRRGHLAPTFADAELTPFGKFPINGYDVDDPGVIFENWTLTVGGAVQKPGDYNLAQIQALPRTRQNTRHVCVEGWDVIGRFGGARLSDFLTTIGADTSARFIAVTCADDYYETLDMATALHPQTLLCYEMYDQPLTRPHGAPLRLNVPTKVGYKQAKYLTDLKVTNVVEKVGYWEDQGYSKFYGL